MTQGLLGAAAAQACFGSRLGRRAALIGAVGGVLADADFVMRPLSDPAFPVEYHRHFTHALAFIPVGGALAALPFLVRRAGRSWEVLFAAMLAYATHPLLDACTSYGTLLYWPLSDARVAWDFISIVDPVFTLILALGVIVSLVKPRRGPPRLAIAACVACVVYMAFGAAQHSSALDVQQRIAGERGHLIERGRALPTLGNLVVWRSVYVTDGELYADSVRVIPLGKTAHRGGTSRAVATEQDLESARVSSSKQTSGSGLPNLAPVRNADRSPYGEEIRSAEDRRAPGGESRRALRVFRGFRWFADGYVSVVSRDPLVVGDARYSLESAGFSPLWGVRFTREGRELQPEWRNLVRESRPAFGVLLDDLLWTDSSH